MSTEETLIGPRLQLLQRDIEAGSASALEAFWQEVATRGTPLVEPIEDDATYSLVSFVWRAPDETASDAHRPKRPATAWRHRRRSQAEGLSRIPNILLLPCRHASADHCTPAAFR